MVVGGKLKINNRKKAELIQEMKSTHGFVDFFFVKQFLHELWLNMILNLILMITQI